MNTRMEIDEIMGGRLSDAREAADRSSRRAHARALVIGAGGLGTPAALGLLASGLRSITILDPDRVELTNLHRQFLYREEDVGRPKVEALAEALGMRCADATIDAVHAAFDASFHSRLGAFDVVIEGTDRFETKLAIADACIDQAVPFVFGGVVAFDGQVLGVRPSVSACPRCLFDEAPPPGAAPTCDVLGILGPIAGIVAARQVEVACSLLDGQSEELNRLWVYDGRRNRARTVPLRRAADCRGCGDRKSLRGVVSGFNAQEAIEAPILDLSGEVCPETYVRTRRALESMARGSCLWVVLTSDESFRGVSASAEAAGHKTLARISDGRVHRVLLEAAGA
ncbi:MAG: ThiF family adenylyltransferase [Deltaproteobacteria bacterium]|nr:ThiF family adenylyltransferase [Deltaproteobacteria bacterium]